MPSRSSSAKTSALLDDEIPRTATIEAMPMATPPAVRIVRLQGGTAVADEAGVNEDVCEAVPQVSTIGMAMVAAVEEEVRHQEIGIHAARTQELQTSCSQNTSDGLERTRGR